MNSRRDHRKAAAPLGGAGVNVELPAEELLARVAQQDVAALSELYDRYAPRVYGLAARILPALAEAEDVVQHTFVRLWNESAALRRDGASVAGWLVVTARQTAVNRLRAQRRNARSAAPENCDPAKGASTEAARVKVSTLTGKAAAGRSGTTNRGPVTAKESPAAEPVPSAWLPLAKEIALIDHRLALLQKVLDQLPKAQREALELAVFGGLSEAEIAAETGEPLGKVQRSLRAAVTFVKHRRRAVCGTWAANI